MSSKLSTYARKQKAAAMAASRWGKPTFNGNVKDAETQTEISIEPSCQTHKEIPVSVAVTSTAPKPPDVACEKTVLGVRTREPVKCPSEPEQLQCLDSSSINEALEATDLQPLSQDSVEQHTTRKKACKLSLKAALSREFQAT